MVDTMSTPTSNTPLPKVEKCYILRVEDGIETREESTCANIRNAVIFNVRHANDKNGKPFAEMRLGWNGGFFNPGNPQTFIYRAYVRGAALEVFNGMGLVRGDVVNLKVFSRLDDRTGHLLGGEVLPGGLPIAGTDKLTPPMAMGTVFVADGYPKITKLGHRDLVASRFDTTDDPGEMPPARSSIPEDQDIPREYDYPQAA